MNKTCGLNRGELDAHPTWITAIGICTALKPDGAQCNCPYSAHESQQIQIGFPRSDLVAIVARALHKDPEERVIETLFSQFGADCYNISSGKVSESAIRTIYTKALNSLSTRTKKIIQEKHPDCLFDSIIAVGQGNTVIIKVMYKAVCCSAKIGSSDDIEREVRIARSFSGRKPFLMEVLEVIPMSMDDNYTRLAMITPLYSAVLHDFTGRRCLELFVRVTVCTFLSIREFNRIGFCHGDIKPKNLMVNSNSKFVTMIDFGESSQYGTDMMKDSMWYPLDCVRTASLHYDLTCLASTLWELWQGRGQQEEDVRTRAELRTVVASCKSEL
eukprot:gene41870-56705_t